MTILDRANAFIGHEQEVDEGLETYMRRQAFIAGFKEALGLVKKMREAQMDKDILEMRLRFKIDQDEKISDEDNVEFATSMCNVTFYEDKVDEWIEKLK